MITGFEAILPHPFHSFIVVKVLRENDQINLKKFQKIIGLEIFLG